MTSSIVKFAAVSSLLMLAACNPFPTTSTTPSGTTVDAGEVRSAVESYAAKFNAHDAAGAAAFYANDPAFHWIESGRLQYATREAAEKGLVDFLAGFPQSRLEFHNIRVDAVGDGVAVATVDFRQTLAVNGGYAFEGAMTMTMVKRDGNWKVVVGHSSTGQLPR